MNARVSYSTVIRHRQEIIRYCFSNESLILIFHNSAIHDQVPFQIFSTRRNAFSDFSYRFPLYFLVVGGNRPFALRGHVTNTSLRQLVGVLLMPKIDRAHKNYLTPKIWEEKHLREIFYGTLIFQQTSMICIGRHVGGHTWRPKLLFAYILLNFS